MRRCEQLSRALPEFRDLHFNRLSLVLIGERVDVYGTLARSSQETIMRDTIQIAIMGDHAHSSFVIIATNGRVAHHRSTS